MYVILVIFFVNRIVSAQDSSDETKYIDLLPEKEKEEFLERIARRLFDGVQTKDNRDIVSGEVSESQLDEHDEFVKQILKEESSNLRKSGVDIEDKKNEDNLKRDDDHVNESVEKKNNHKTEDNAELVDLTLRDGKRNKRNSLAKTNENSKIIHVSVGNGDMEVPNKEDGLSNVDLTQDKSRLEAEDIQIKFFKRNPVKNTNVFEVTTQSSDKYLITHMTDFEDETVKDDSKGTVAASEDNIDISPETKKEVVNEDKTTGNINKNIDNNNFESTKNNYESLRNEETENSSEEKSAVPEAEESTTVSEPTSIDVKPTVVPTEKVSIENSPTEGYHNLNARSFGNTVGVTLENNKELDENKNTTEDSKDDGKLDVHTTVAVGTVNDLEPGSNHNKEIAKGLEKLNSDNITTNETNKNTTYNEHTTEKYTEVGSTTLKTEVLTITSLRTEAEKESNTEELISGNENNLNQIKNPVENNKEVSSKELIGGNEKDTKINSIINEKVKHDALDKDSYNLANDMINVLRTEIKPESYIDENNFNGLRALYDATKPKEYKVYEVPASKQPLLQKDQLDTTNKENPYYVPIYNYSPNNAYYNPYNRLGPNADDEDKTNINRNLEDDKNNDLDENEREDYSFDYKNNDRDETNVGKERVSEERKAHDRDFADADEQKRDYNKDRDNAIQSLIKKIKNYNNLRKFRFGSAQPKHNKISPYKFIRPVVVHYPKFTDIILNHNDYLDMDYYYGRAQKTPNIRSRCEIDRKEIKGFPDSNEEDHPYNSMNAGNNLKDHMRAMRQLLYRQKHFGYIPPPNYTAPEPFQHEKDVLRSNSKANTRHSKQTNDNNIAMDYFFGRMNENIDTETHTKGMLFHQNSNKHSSKFNDYKTDRNTIPHFHDNHWYSKVTPAYNKDIGSPRYKPNLRGKKKKYTDFETIRQVLSMVDENDLLITLDELLKLNLTVRTNDEVDLEPYVSVLKDLVRNDAKALKQYDWLSTTVDIQSALVKLMDMTEELQNNITVAQPDLELLKYMIYLHKSRKKIETKYSRKNRLLPRNKKKKKGIIKESGLLNRHWLFRMMAQKHDIIITKKDLNRFGEFLNELQYYLYDLHTAVQQIANVTNYHSQRWYDNLKELYLNNERKNLLEILLHVTITRLLDLIEESAKNGAEDDFLTYVINNDKEVERTKAEFAFALKIIDELKMIE